jgi:hypothetical protein
MPETVAGKIFDGQNFAALAGMQVILRANEEIGLVTTKTR